MDFDKNNLLFKAIRARSVRPGASGRIKEKAGMTSCLRMSACMGGNSFFCREEWETGLRRGLRPDAAARRDRSGRGSSLLYSSARTKNSTI